MEKESIFTLRYLWNLILRRLNLVLILFCLIFISLLIYNLRKPYTPIYKAVFEIGVSRERPSETFFTERTSPYSSFYQMGGVIQKVISSLMNLEITRKVADSLELYVKIENGISDIKIESKVRKEFDGVLGPFNIKFLNNREFEVRTQEGKILGKGNTDEYFSLDYIDFKIIPNGRKTQPFKITFYSPYRVALALRNSVNIKVLEASNIEKEFSSGIPYSGEAISKNLVTSGELYPSINLLGIMRINLYWGNPRDALKIAKLLSDLIIKQDIYEKSKQYIQSRKFIESQLSLYSSKLDSIEDAIKKFKETKKIANLGSWTQALISRVSDLESRKDKIEINQKMLSSLKEKLSSGEIIGDTLSSFATVLLNDPVLQNLYSNLLEIEAEYNAYTKEYSPEHPKVREVLAKLSALQNQLNNEISKKIESMKSEKQSIQNQIFLLQSKLENIPENELILAKLEREKERTEKLYSFFAEKLEETRVQEAGVTSDLKIINPPFVSYNPINKRNPFLLLAFYFLISFIISVIIALTIEYFDTRIKDAGLIRTRTGIPIFGLIPELNQKNNLLFRILKRSEKQPVRKILDDKSSHEFESFRKLYVNIRFAHPEKKYNVIYITSPGPEEGKTFITSNLGVVLSLSGKKTLILDTDFRKKKGHLTEVFELKEGKGLFDYLKGNVKLNDIINKGLNENLYIIGIGEIPLDPATYIESEKFQKMLSELKNKFDYILIDGVPVLLFADVSYLSPQTDGVFIVIKYAHTHFDALEETINTLRPSRTNIIGIIFNGIPLKKGDYYYYKYYKYYSKYYQKNK